MKYSVQSTHSRSVIYPFCLDEKRNKEFSFEKPKKKTAVVVFHFVAAVQKQDNFKT